MAVTLTQLVAFLTVVRRGSVTAAARGAGRDTAVGFRGRVGARARAGRAADRAGGADRAAHGGGRGLCARTRRDVLGLLEQGARAAREAEEARPHTLRISAVTTAGEYLVPQLIQAFRERRPEVEISLDVGNRELVFQRVLDHKVDVAVTGRIPDDDRFVGVDFADNEFVLVTSRRRPARPAPLGRDRGARARGPWLLREPGSGTRTLCEEFLASRGIAPNVLTLGSNGAIKQAARAGLGIALQSRAAVELELKLGLLDTITPRGGLPERRWHVVRSAIGPVREDVEAFMSFCTSPAARHALSG